MLPVSELLGRVHPSFGYPACDRMSGRAHPHLEIVARAIFEGLTTPEIRASRPGWSLWTDGCSDGESPEQVGARADRVLDRLPEHYRQVLIWRHWDELTFDEIGARLGKSADLRRTLGCSLKPQTGGLNLRIVLHQGAQQILWPEWLVLRMQRRGGDSEHAEANPA